ncbi:hypothetical protein RJ640_020208 [Escallonia rubra]|uniref:DIS3-like exonuclease 2 n=1 Tax=Escallonia rubra TaxID=112253 RepID=A0AA88UKS4_9ASTE|nr:hypothetical protein RJ640_020208 [Escallonia rubra]
MKGVVYEQTPEVSGDISKDNKKKKRRARRGSKQSPSVSAYALCHPVSLPQVYGNLFVEGKNELIRWIICCHVHALPPSLSLSLVHACCCADYWLLAVCSSATELRLEASEFSGTCSIFNSVEPEEQQLLQASNIAFNSLPTMHLSEEVAAREGGSMQDQHMFQSDFSESIFSQSCPEPIALDAAVGSNVKKSFPLSQQIECHSQKKYFDSHWSSEAVTQELEKGNTFKALFRVNVHNRLEAYCKIDGVPTDILISGAAAQNRAVEGDIVLIKVDRFSLWTKMKGSILTSNNPAVMEDNNLLPTTATESVRDYCKEKNKVDGVGEYADCSSVLPLSVDGFHCESSAYLSQNVITENVGPAVCQHVNRNCHHGYDASLADCSSEQKEAVSAVEKLCATISLFPSKRPTGRVVAIIEMSPRRDAVVGFLGVKEWFSSREGYMKDSKKNKPSLLSSRREYIPLTPTDPKFPRMMVPVKSLPDCIKERLEQCDGTVEMELVAACIVDWREEYMFPQALVMHVFGRGGELQAHIAAILFENAIHSSDFSAETLSCLPRVPWEVPREELQSRRDIRNLCLFTIDPSTATDLDDALSVQWLSNGIYRVGVHIADVSYFVLPDTALDIEAQMRSTSVYLLHSKLSMLPSLLSENIGSLNPGVDRLAFSIFWDINLAGQVLDRWIGRTVIRSCCKLSYEHAQDIIDGLFDVEGFNSSEYGCPDFHGQFEWSDVIRSVKCLHEISKSLKEKRFNDGALSLENHKLVFLLDDNGIPYNSMLCGRKDSNFLVEEFMLLANRTAAEVISRAYPSSALLRRHPEPNLRKLREFESFCSKHGLALETSSSGQLQQSLERIRLDLKDDTVLLDVLISYATRPMQLAAYFSSGDLDDSVGDWSHYALAVPLYTHFTSPLRRYPDIVVHRTLAATVDAEEMYLKQKRRVQGPTGERVTRRCFSGISFDKDGAKSAEAREALSGAALKHRVPRPDILADVAAHCNERKLASRHVKDAIDKLCMWLLLRKKEIIFSEARVLGLGPRFMSIYIHKLAIERRIHYDEVDGLAVEWLDATSTLVLSNKRSQKRGSQGKYRMLDEVVLVTSPCSLMQEVDFPEGRGIEGSATLTEGYTSNFCISESLDIEPAVFPVTVRLLSTIPVVLNAVGGDDGPLDIGARLYISSYFQGL